MTAKFGNWRELAHVGPSDQISVPATDDAGTVEREMVPTLVTPKGLTPVMLEEALGASYRALGFSESKMSALMGMLKNDAAGAVNQTYHSAKMAAAKQRASTVRTDIVVKYQLLDDDITALSEYAKEYRLVFQGKEHHDHPMAAACRLIDHKLISARVPPGLPVSDIGGNPLVYIKSKQDHVHVCGPTIDMKDLQRHSLRRSEARKLAGDRNEEEAVRSLARAYMEGGNEFVCGKRAQECTKRTPVLTAVHVYDIPLQDWPGIMENKYAAVVEGCVLFSEKFFEKTDGELAVSGARYEIDLADDSFRMGFTRSPAWWYKHKWSEYSAYGVDQTLYTKDAVYSYKVVERRKDTLFFRILRLQSNNPTHAKTVLKRPGVKMVSVNGFELSDSGRLGGKPFRRRQYTFPRNLWYEMVSQASEDFERGVMDYTRMFAHYRTISVRQTINAVCVMGGEPVSSQELVPLVVHSCLAAAAQSLLGQKETRVLTSVTMAGRARMAESTLRKVGGALVAMAKGVALLSLYPFKLLAGMLKDGHVSMLESWVLDWEPQVDHIEIDSKLLFSTAPFLAPTANQVLDESARLVAPFDYIHAVMTNAPLRKAFSALFPGADGVGEVAEASESAAVNDSPPTYHTYEQLELPDDEPVQRTAAIREHINEIELMNRAVEFVCAEAYAKLCVAGKPSVGVLSKHAESYSNPDLWHVVNGVITGSVLKQNVKDFKHSAVFHPIPDPDTGSRVRAVYDSSYDGYDADGRPEHREHKVLADLSFTGLVLVTDHLVIYNGPEILQSMQAALSLDHDYLVTVERGPPGCGKTYSIVTQFKPGEDFVVCPVRESIEDTRKQIAERHPQCRELRMSARTIDSYLTNYRSGKNSQLSTERLLVDECYMTHAGKIYAVAALLGASQVLAFGDEHQIPHIPRVQASKLFVKLRSQAEKFVWTTRRCPASAVAAWGHIYDWKVRSLSKVDGELKMVHSTKGRTVPRGCTMMCMYQADKVELRKRYASELGHIKILTAHESEGKTYTDVWLHRFDARRRSDKSSLFDQAPHTLVAMSRHTNSFLYYCPADIGDLPSQWIKKAANPRRVAAAQDVESAGISKELL